MAEQKNNNKGWLAVLLAAVLGYGVGKAIENAQGGKADKEAQEELERLRKLIDEEFLKGMHENNIVNALIVYSRNQMGDKMTDAHIDKIRSWVLEEKVRLQKEGKI